MSESVHFVCFEKGSSGEGLRKLDVWPGSQDWRDGDESTEVREDLGLLHARA